MTKAAMSHFCLVQARAMGCSVVASLALFATVFIFFREILGFDSDQVLDFFPPLKVAVSLHLSIAATIAGIEIRNFADPLVSSGGESEDDSTEDEKEDESGSDDSEEGSDDEYDSYDESRECEMSLVECSGPFACGAASVLLVLALSGSAVAWVYMMWAFVWNFLGLGRYSSLSCWCCRLAVWQFWLEHWYGAFIGEIVIAYENISTLLKRICCFQ